ncbi:hypothetical protein Tco_1550870, partial [Tanacetum coccineum]
MLPCPYSNLDPEYAWYEMLGQNKLDVGLVQHEPGLLEHELEQVAVGPSISDRSLGQAEYNKVEHAVGQ